MSPRATILLSTLLRNKDSANLLPKPKTAENKATPKESLSNKSKCTRQWTHTFIIACDTFSTRL